VDKKEEWNSRSSDANAKRFPMSHRRIIAALLPAEHRLHFLVVLLSMIVAAVLQMGGVVSVMPFIALVADPEIIQRNEWMRWSYELLGVRSTNEYLVVLGCFTFLLLAVTTGFAAFSRWLNLRFVWDLHDTLTQRLLSRYLHETYSFYLSRNTSDLSRGLLNDVRTVVDNVVLAWMEVVARAVLVGAFVLLMVIADPYLALVSGGSIAVAYGAVYLAVRGKQQDLGQRRHDAFCERFQITAEAFGGMKDVKVLGIEQFFLSRFEEASRRYSRTITAHSMISELPRYAFETVAFGAIIGAIIYLLTTRETLAHVLPLLALYTLSAYRLIPALQTIFSSLARARFYLPSAVALSADLADAETSSPLPHASMTERAAKGEASIQLAREIRFQHMTFAYPGTARPALHDISLVIPVNATVGVVGATGSGKTTLVDLLLGLFTPTEGEILIDDVELLPARLHAWKQRVGYVPQSIFLTDTSIRDNIAFGVAPDRIDHAAVERAARAAHLHGFIERLPERYDTLVGERGIRLSGGERQRIAIARALYRNPQVLVLDEATSALDGTTEEAVTEAIRSLAGRKTIVMIAHRLSTVRDCDRIYLIEAGRLAAAGTYDELIAANPTFRALARGGLTGEFVQAGRM
jgi:ATP-binding cassette, subfamily B, bacterial PglK